MDLSGAIGFDWDSGNIRKNEKHGVSPPEAEQVFLNRPLLLTPHEEHSHSERRSRAFGRTDNGRWLTVIFTIRGNGTLIRIISVRDMHRKERLLYAQET